jgi:hypothetical protein
MIENGPATTDEMILAFLQAEVPSPNFGHLYAQWLRHFGCDDRIVTQPNLHDHGENRIRAQLLTNVRGYGTNEYLFTGFPADVTWRHVTLAAQEVAALQYANEPTWARLSVHTRRVHIGAQHLTPDMGKASENIMAVANAIQRGEIFPALIAVTNAGDPIVLLEGHTRATAYALTNSPAHLILGTSPHIRNWRYW